jgi:putative tricarboxylic transport membrane protein
VSRAVRFRVLVSLGVVALGVLTCVGAGQLPAAAGYARVGPGLFPWLVGLGAIAVGAALALQAGTGRWRQGERASPATASEGRVRRGPLVAILAGAVLHATLIGPLGFIAASTLLFTVVARAFGSRQAGRDGALGFVLAAAAYAFFTRVVSVALPAGRLFERLFA